MRYDHTRLGRRAFLGSAVAGGFSLVGCGKPSHCLRDASATVSLQTEPRRIQSYPIAERWRPESSELEQLASIVRPPEALVQYTTGLLYHLLRLWGKDATFSSLPFQAKPLRGDWGRIMFDCLTDEQIFAEWCKSSTKRLFAEVEGGLKVRTSLDRSFQSKWTSTHPGTYVQVMAELGIPPDCEIKVLYADGAKYMLSDVIRTNARRVDTQVELEWTATSLARYVTDRCWQDRFGVRTGFDAIADALVQKDFGEGACFGEHIPFALASLLNVGRSNVLLSERSCHAIETRLREYRDRLLVCQDSDGAWPPDWYDPNSSKSRFTWGSDSIDALAATGHHLEWLAIVPPILRLEDESLGRACRWICRTIIAERALIRSEWHYLLPITHAVKAIADATGTLGQFRSIAD